jgi:PAS domain S-box-containing protein
MKKFENSFSLISLLCAGTTMLFGIVVLMGWLGKIPQLVQLTPLAFIQANTALCFFLSGTALFLLNRSYFSAVRFLSFLILFFGGLTLSEYLFQVNFGIDELLFKDIIHSGASHPNRMAPNTALCFSLLAVAFFVSTFSLKSTMNNLLASIFGALVFVLSSMALSGFLVGLEEAFGWGRMTRMSPQTAIAFLIVSFGIISLAWRNAMKVERGFPVWFPSFASLAVIIIFIGVWQSLVAGERQFIRSDIELAHAAFTNKIHFELKDRVLSLQRMGKRFEVNFYEDQYQVEWELDAKNYVNHFNDYKSLDWVDSDYRVQWSVVPMGVKEALGLDLAVSPQLAPDKNIIGENMGVWISPVLNTPQNEKVFSVFVPLFAEEKFLGFIRGNFILDRFLEYIFKDGDDEFQIFIQADSKLLFLRDIGEVEDSEQWGVSSVAEYKNLKWFIQSIPRQAYVSRLRTMKPDVVMFFGLILAWALGVAVRSYQITREQELKLVSINEKLRKESEKGSQQKLALEISQKKYKTLFNQVKDILEEVSRESGKKLYATLVQNLAVSLGFKYCLIGELDAMNNNKVSTLAVWGDSNFLENFIYDLPGSPCENILGGSPSAYSVKTWEKFPHHKILRDLNIEAYVGVPLNDSSNNPMGILCAMHDEAVEDLTQAQLVLSLFADVAQSEMERQIYESQLQWETGMVQLSRDIAMAANDYPDAESTLKLVLQRLCQFMGWPVGHIYLKSNYSTSLVPSRLWHIEDPEKYQVLKTITEQTTFESGIGLPGRVVATGRPEWVRDVRTDNNFPRAEKNQNLGVRTALACPVTLRKEVVGVMEFFTPRILDVDWEVLDMIERLGTQVGRVLERKESDEVLRKQAEVLDQIHDAVISLDLSMNIIGWNRGAEHIFLYPESEVMNQSVSVLFPMSEEIFKQMAILPTQIKGSHEMEISATRKDEEKVFVHLSFSSLCNEKCVPQTFVCYALDITERKKMEMEKQEKDQELEKVYKQNEMILNAAGEGIYGIDLQGNTTFVNPSASKMLGYSPLELIGESQHSLTHHSKPDGSNYPHEDCLIYAVLKDGKIYSEDNEVFWRKNGTSFPVEYVSMPIYENGELSGAVVTFKDITEKKQARLELEKYSQNLEEMVSQRTVELDRSLMEIQEAKNHIEGILKSIGEGILVTDYYGKLVLMNPAAELIFGVKKENALNKNIEEVVDNKSFLECWNIKINEKYLSKSFDFEIAENGCEESRKFFRGSSTLLLGDDNFSMGIVVVIRDMTFEKKVDNLKSQFLSTAAHELRTPLTSLQGFSEILLNRKNLDKKTEKKYLQYINEESLTLATIINDFLDISRIESGKGISLDKTVCSVNETIDRSMHIFDEGVNVLHEFNLICPADKINWEVDRDKVEQVFRNIYSNAIKYSPNGGTITTTVKRDEKFVEVMIEDEGMGMDAEQLSRIYDKFYRGANVENNFPGSGLGMTIVKYILEAHGGSVTVESTVGQGTRVFMKIPRN